MPNPAPVPGKCNALRKDKISYCGNKPHIPAHLGGNGRCKHHGGLSTGAVTPNVRRNALKHGLYARRLENSFKEEDRATFRNMPIGTDLSTEIQLWRMKILQFQEMLARGEDKMETGTHTDTGQPRTCNVEDLLARATALLARLLRDQHEMHPEAGQAGKLKISITVSDAAKAAGNEDIGDLEAGTAAVDETPTIEQLEAPAAPTSPLAGFDE